MAGRVDHHGMRPRFRFAVLAVTALALSSGCTASKEEALEQIRTEPEKVEQELSEEIAKDPEEFKAEFVKAITENAGGAVTEEQANCIADMAAEDPELLRKLAEFGLDAESGALPDNATMTKLTDFFAACALVPAG